MQEEKALGGAARAAPAAGGAAPVRGRGPNEFANDELLVGETEEAEEVPMDTVSSEKD